MERTSTEIALQVSVMIIYSLEWSFPSDLSSMPIPECDY